MLFFDLSPVLLMIPITACIVVEVETRAKFCVIVGAVPGEACQMKGLSRTAALGLCVVAYAASALPVLGLAYFRQCTFAEALYWQLVPVVQMKALAEAGFQCPRI